ncbi:uncharacterized protein PAN0_025c6142 [Moesziomyces antarcticus]|uniref:Uncharacterized protein n=1 Tax=Pseudozyma antarctica TaxID=84753 RepID=A0A081CML6_PSEA2|nr:uncharacterized protein PAN0_025c6142 [Moesziomyces antarcticus]GAK67912.1 hypothetical protein PAN0_025c6142 [Moesziomyces antarcticus]
MAIRRYRALESAADLSFKAATGMADFQNEVATPCSPQTTVYRYHGMVRLDLAVVTDMVVTDVVVTLAVTSPRTADLAVSKLALAFTHSNP